MNFEAIKKAAQDYRPAMAKFLRDMIAIPSESCQEEGVVRRIAQEMESLGYDKVEFDKLGNVIGWMGTGDKIIALDSHIDTVGIGNIENWEADPYQGYEDDAVIFGRTDDPDRIHQLALFHGLESDGHIGLFLVIQRSLRHFDLCRQLTGRIRHGSQPFRLNHQHRIGRYLEREPAESVRFGFGKSPLSMDNRPLDRDAVLVEDDGFDIQTPLFYLILRPSTERAQQQKDKTQFYYVIHRR